MCCRKLWEASGLSFMWSASPSGWPPFSVSHAQAYAFFFFFFFFFRCTSCTKHLVPTSNVCLHARPRPRGTRTPRPVLARYM